MAKKKAASGSASNGIAANLGFEAKLWLTADKLRNNMDAAEYKHVVLGLIFLKYISDAFEERHQKLLAEVSEGADPEDPDEYRADNVFWVPTEARWQTLQDNAKQPTIGKLIDRVHREPTDADITRIADTYHSWRGDQTARQEPRRPCTPTSPASANQPRPPRSPSTATC